MVPPGLTSKAFASSLLARAAARVPVEWLRSFSGVSLVVPYYHLVSDYQVPHVSHLYRFRTIAEFKSDVEFFLRSFEPVSLSDIVDALDERRAFTRPAFHLTFDDGFREMHDIVAPILQHAGVPATFFLNTAFLDGAGLAHHNALSVLLDKLHSRKAYPSAASLRRVKSLLPLAHNGCSTLSARILSIPYALKSLVRLIAQALEVDLDSYVRENQPYLSSDQISSLLARGFSIGAHSHDHPRYADLTLPEQLSQTRTSLELLDTRFGLKPKTFAFPHHDKGVGDPFFSAVFSEHLLDASFGTAGLIRHRCPRNIERIRMEQTAAPASHILARQFARAAYFRLRPQ